MEKSLDYLGRTKRRPAKIVKIGNLKIGGNEPIAIQSMLDLPPNKVAENIKEALYLESLGCDIIRVAVPNKDALILIKKLKENVKMPVVADIHFDYKLAIESVKAGADKIRINPGNIGSTEKIKAVINACNEKNVPIRIGVNSGSLEKDILKKHGAPTAEALFESALRNIKIFENLDFNNIVLSVKSSDVVTTFLAYKLLAENFSYPLHLGITETGSGNLAVVKSSIGIGSLLLNGIGDTIRVSLTGKKEDEIICAKDILKSLSLLKNYGVEIISCPTCGRTKIDILNITKKVKEELKFFKKNIKIAIMGCSVNGPGEAKEADIGIAGGDGFGVLFKKGKIVKTLPEEELVSALVSEVKNFKN